MGGQVNTPAAASYGMRAWNINSWGAQNEVEESLTGLGLTSSIGELSAFNEQGWGSDGWGEEGWNGANTITLTGVSATASVGEAGDFAHAVVNLGEHTGAGGAGHIEYIKSALIAPHNVQ